MKAYRHTLANYRFFGDPHFQIGAIPPNGPTIVSIPRGWAGPDYCYDQDSTAEARSAGKVRWRKASGPEGFAISANGIVSWQPIPGIEPGNDGYPTIVIAAEDGSGTSLQRWSVQNQPDYPQTCETKQPPPDATVGELYEFNPSFSVDPSSFWKKIEGPDGLLVDRLTGRVSWRPDHVGEFEVILAAFARFFPDWLSGSRYPDLQRYVISVHPNATGTGIDPATIPDVDRICHNYPNPFNPSTTIRFGLNKSGHVHLDVYDQLGRRIRQLVDREMPVGWHEVVFEAEGISSGIYYCRLVSETRTMTQKLILQH